MAFYEHNATYIHKPGPGLSNRLTLTPSLSAGFTYQGKLSGLPLD